VDVNDKINSNSISCNTWKWPKKTLLLPTWPKYHENLHNSQIIWEETATHIVPITTFRGSYPCCTGCTPTSFNFKTQLATFTFTFKNSNHWPAKGCSWRCNVCSSQVKTSRWFYFCEDSYVGLCIYLCFKLYHTRLHYWVSPRVKSNLQQWSPLMCNISSSLPLILLLVLLLLKCMPFSFHNQHHQCSQ
jgi:hypothetical protein